jgi:uncharacterized protein
MSLIVAISIGFLGGFHCLGMCGPIALAVPLPSKNSWIRLAGVGLYNLGRIFTYALMGLTFGYFGSHFRMAGWQRHLSIAVGLLLLGWALLSLFGGGRRLWGGGGVWSWLSPAMGSLIRRREMAVLPVLGMLNGLLPCGLVYMGISGSLLMFDPWKGAAFMAFFGLGTLPFMVAVPMLASRITPKWRSGIRRVYPWLVLLMAVLFLVRGMNLNIPYLSPGIDYAGGIGPACE